MTVKRMDNVGIVVEDIDAAIEFFITLARNNGDNNVSDQRIRE